MGRRLKQSYSQTIMRIIVCLVFVQFFSAVLCKILADITCADVVTLHADGIQIGAHNNKITSKALYIPSNTKILGVRCQINSPMSTSGGILASFKMEREGDYITDGTWRCTNQYIPEWSSTSFNDDTWPYANTFGNNSNSNNHGRAQGLEQVPGIVEHAKWIWTSNYDAINGDLVVFCRGNIALEGTKDNYGRKFVIGFIENNRKPEFHPGDLKLLITTLKPTEVTVFIYTPLLSPGNAGYLSEAHTITVGEVTMLTLPKELQHENNHIIQDKVILLIATNKVRVVGENHEVYSTDLFLSMPITSLGKETDTNEYYGICWNLGTDCRILMAAAYDNTVIYVNPTETVVFGGTTYKAGQNIQITLNKYQSLQLGSKTSTGLTSTHIQSNKPIAVYSGNMKTMVSNFGRGGTVNHIVEQLMPVKMWGKTFILTPLPYGAVGNDVTRYEQYLAHYVYLASEDNTTVSTKYYGSSGAYLSVVTNTLNKGGTYLLRKRKGIICVMNATKAIQLAQFATTSSHVFGDPWMQIIPPIYEFGRDYTLLTPNLTVFSGSLSTHYFTVLIAESEKSGVMINKQKINASSYISIPGTDLVYQTIEIDFGKHRVEHEKTSVSYGLYFFGYGEYDAYATMGGTRMALINQMCTVSSSTPGDGLDNDCDGSIDEDTCTGSQSSMDCAPMQPVDGGWSTWSVTGPCVCQNGSSSGTETHLRTCTNPVPIYDGWPCNTSVKGYSKEVACTCTPVNGSWTEWGDFSDCSAGCDSGKQIRSRSCINPFPANGGSECFGSRIDEQDCNLMPCKNINGSWSNWELSGTCVCPSGSFEGSQKYERSCSNPAPLNKGSDCDNSIHGARTEEFCSCLKTTNQQSLNTSPVKISGRFIKTYSNYKSSVTGSKRHTDIAVPQKCAMLCQFINMKDTTCYGFQYDINGHICDLLAVWFSGNPAENTLLGLQLIPYVGSDIYALKECSIDAFKCKVLNITTPAESLGSGIYHMVEKNLLWQRPIYKRSFDDFHVHFLHVDEIWAISQSLDKYISAGYKTDIISMSQSTRSCTPFVSWLLMKVSIVCLQ